MSHFLARSPVDWCISLLAGVTLVFSSFEMMTVGLGLGCPPSSGHWAYLVGCPKEGGLFFVLCCFGVWRSWSLEFWSFGVLEFWSFGAPVTDSNPPTSLPSPIILMSTLFVLPDVQ